MKRNISHKYNWAVLILSLLPAAVVIFQTNRFWDIYDASYILENAYLITVGKLPYRDFVIHTTPGTFLIQALIIKFIGFSLYSQIFYCCIISVLTFLLTYRIIFFFSNDKLINTALALPVSITGGYGILSVPFYDTDCVFFILLSLFLILLSYQKSFPKLFTFASGVFVFLPFFFKQNIGLVYLLTIHFILIIAAFYKQSGLTYIKYILFSAGTLTAIFLFIFYLAASSSLESFYLCVFSFIFSHHFKSRSAFFLQNLSNFALRYTFVWLLVIPIIKYLKIKKIWKYILTFIVILTPFYIFPLFKIILRNLPINNYFDNFLFIIPVTINICLIISFYALVYLKQVPLLHKLISFAVLGTMYAALLSHGFGGSNYAIWPLISILCVFIYIGLSGSLFKKEIILLKSMVFINSILMTTILIFYINSNHFLSSLPEYDIKNIVHHSNTEYLKGFSLPGEMVLNMDNFYKVVKEEIPLNDPLIIIPHEDPFYLATRRYPHFPVLMNDITLYIYSVEELINKINIYNVNWMIIKTGLQADVLHGSESSWKNLYPIISYLKDKSILHKNIPGYEIYRISK